MALDVIDINFWLGILRDHTIFIYNSLGPSEKEAARRAESLRYIFENLMKNPGGAAAGDAARATRELIMFKTNLLARCLHCQVVIHLNPSDLNVMINEALEFFRILGELPPLSQDRAARLLHLMRLWIPDAATHSAMLYRVLDPDEHKLLQELQNYEWNFNLMFLKTILKTQMYEKLAADFPSLYEMIPEARQSVESHIVLLNAMERRLESCTVENTGSPLMADHMLREERYFLNQLTQLIA